MLLKYPVGERDKSLVPAVIASLLAPIKRIAERRGSNA